MNPAELLDLTREGLLIVALIVIAPLGAAFAVSLAVGLMGRLTRVTEPGLGQLPRLIVVGATLIAVAPSAAERLCQFSGRILGLIAIVGR